ncbi:hypothetical protein ACFQEX_24010 [Roseibium salinum]|uniref:hypothetical protein n=1 Tax=Roseibium salinum TaxID=1604349 RepID=UPI00360F803C
MTKGGKDDRKQEKADGKPQPQESDAPVPDSGDHGTDQYETFLDQAKELDDAAAETGFSPCCAGSCRFAGNRGSR